MSGEAQDQSMEEILQSIKRIIADEDEGEETAEVTETNGAAEPLELTELVEDDGTITSVDSVPVEEQLPADPVPEAAVLEAEIAKDPEEPLMPEAPAPEPEPVAAAPVSSEGLVSDDALAASASALGALSGEKPAAPAPTPSPVFRSGQTVEDLVMEALKPMLKEWLDANLPQTVERLVQKEIRRITGE